MESNEVLLFPHSFLSPSRAARLRARFATVVMGLPWRLDLEAAAAAGAPGLALRIIRPPQDLDPGQAFPRQLAEYLDWMRLHRDRRSAGIHGGTPLQADVPSRWELRQEIRTVGAPPQETGQAFRWHLLLHLFYRAERDALAAEEILAGAKTGASPLQSALGPDESGGSLLGDLVVTSEPELSEWHDIQGLLEAWAGLFGSQEPGLPLLTFNRGVWEWLAGWAEAAGTETAFLSPSPGLQGLTLPPATAPASQARGLLGRQLAGRVILRLEP